MTPFGDKMRGLLYAVTGFAWFYFAGVMYLTMGSITTTAGPWWRDLLGTCLGFSAPLVLFYLGVTFFVRNRWVAVCAPTLVLTLLVLPTLRFFQPVFIALLLVPLWIFAAVVLLVKYDNVLALLATLGLSLGVLPSLLSSMWYDNWGLNWKVYLFGLFLTSMLLGSAISATIACLSRSAAPE